MLIESFFFECRSPPSSLMCLYPMPFTFSDSRNSSLLNWGLWRDLGMEPDGEYCCFFHAESASLSTDHSASCGLRLIRGALSAFVHMGRTGWMPSTSGGTALD
jgi:hypothetical protein